MGPSGIGRRKRKRRRATAEDTGILADLEDQAEWVRTVEYRDALLTPGMVAVHGVHDLEHHLMDVERVARTLGAHT